MKRLKAFLRIVFSESYHGKSEIHGFNRYEVAEQHGRQIEATNAAKKPETKIIPMIFNSKTSSR